ncbi:hypothetical protein [Pseudomonas phage D6]|nr:hypothetical protein [Pseudomonas phage D6]
MKKNRPKPRKQKKPRAKPKGYQDHSIRPGTGNIVADAVWSGIKRAQPNHRERTIGEMWDRSERTPYFYPTYDAAEVMAGKND